MKAISLWQPWASLWCSDSKIHETRHWPTSHRGWLAVHAAKRIEFDHSPRLNDILDGEFGPHWGLELPRGAIIGAVRIVSCKPTETLFQGALSDADMDDRECGDFGAGRYAWGRSEFIRLPRPLPYRGAQGIFNVPDELVTLPPFQLEAAQ